MTKRPRTLTAAFVRTISRPGVYGDGRGGRGLSLRVHRTVSGRITKTWRQRVRIDGRLTSIGLGPYPEVTLAEARKMALDHSRMVRLGRDPRGRGVPTFAEAAERTIKLHPRWLEGREPAPPAVGDKLPAPRCAIPTQAGRPDHEFGRASVLGADLGLEARRSAAGPLPDRRGVPMVRRTELPSRQPGRPGGRGSPKSDRQRSEAPPRAATPRSSGGAPGDPSHA